MALTLFFVESSFSQTTYYSRLTGGWNAAVWSTTVNGTATTATITANDNVVIQANHNITVNVANAVCNSISMGTSDAVATLTFAATSQLTVSQSVTLGNSGNNNRRGAIVMVNGGRLICRGFIIANGGSNTFTPGTGTVELTADNTLPATIFTSFNNLTISQGKTTTARALTIGLLTVNSNDVFELLHAVTANSVSLEGGCAGTGALISGSSTLTLGGNVTVTDNTGGTAGAVISCPVNLSDTRTFTVADDGTSANDLTISSIISGGTNFGITKAGAGTMVLSGTNTFTGATNVNAGILNIQNARGTGTTAGGVTVASGATLQLQGGIAVGAEALSLAGGGVDGNAAFDNVSGNNSWSGAITLAADATIRNQSNNLTISGAVALAGRQLTLGGASTGGSISGVISGSGSAVSAIRKVTSGTWSLSGANTYTGNILIQSGTLTVGNASALGANANNLSISSGAVANLTSSETVASLTLDVMGTQNGTWGSDTSAATNRNNTYFTSTGILTVSNDTRTTPTVTPTVGTYTYSRSAQGPNTATNTGTGTSYTYSYAGVAPTVYGPSATRPTNAGSYTVTVTVAANVNFTAATSSATAFTINQFALSVTGLTGNSKTFNGTTAATATGTAALSGVISPDVVTLSGTPVFTFASANVGTGISISTSGYTLSGANAANYTLTQPTLSANITATTVTVTPTVGTYTYSGSAQGPNTATNTGTGTSYTYSYAGVAPTVYATSATAPTNAGTYTVTATVAANGNFAAATSSATAFTIGQKALTINGVFATNKEYDGTTVTTLNSDLASLSGVVSSDVVSIDSSIAFGTFATPNVGTGIAVTASGFSLSGADAANYSLTQPTGFSANITPKGITIFANNSNKCLGSTLTFAGNEFTTSTEESDTTITAVTLTSTGAISSAGVGTYPIVPSNAVGTGLSNYTINYVSGNLMVASSPTTTGVSVCPGGSGALTSSASCISASISGGVKNPSSVANTTGIGNVAWSNPSNALTNNGTAASVTLSDVTRISNYLVSSNHSFDIPSNAIIMGIKVVINKYATNFIGFTRLRDNQVRLVKSGTIVGNNKANLGVDWPQTEQASTYGSVIDLWGTTWTAADINNANFGVALSVLNATSFLIVPYSGEVDAISIEVMYGLPGTLSWFTASSGGTAIGSGTSFNPVGVAGSPLVNTNTPGTTTFFAECSSLPGCRTATDFVITANPTAPIAINNTKIYTGIANTTSISATPQANQTIDWYQDATGGSPLLSGSTTYIPTAVNVGTYTFYAAARATSLGCTSTTRTAVTLTINKAPLTVTATNQTVSFGTSEASVTGAGTYTATGFVNGETAAVISGIVSYTTTYTATTNAGTSGITITPDVSGLTATNYSFGTVAIGTITIGNATPIVTPIIGSYTYTGLPQGPNSATNTGSGATYTYSYVGVSGTSYTASATPPTAVGSYTVTATVAADGNFAIASSVPTAFTIGKAVLTITANNQAVSFGVTVASVTGAGTYTATGFVNGETATVISGAATYTTTYTTTTASGTVGVTITPNVSGLSAANYSFVGANGTIDINTKITPTLSVTIGSYTYTGLPQGPNTATNSGTGSTYSYSYSGSGSTVYGPSATLPTVAGSYIVKATVAASIDGVYNAVTSAETAFTINKATLTLTASSANKTYGTVRSTPLTGSTAYTITSGSLKNGETIGSVTLSYGTGALAATDAVGSTSIITPSAATGGTFSVNNYTITYNTGTLTVTPLAITVRATGPTKIYGTALTTGTSTSNFTVTGTLPSGQAITSVTLTPNANGLSATTAAGAAYTVTPSLATGTGGFLASNYSITYVAHSGVVATKALTITANAVSKVYGDELISPETGSTLFTTNGLVGSETVGSVTLNYGTGAATTSVVGTYAGSVVPSAAIGGTFTASNYAITYVGGTTTVNTAALTVTAQDQSKCFGANVVFFGDEFLTAGLKNTDIVNTVSLSSTASSTATVAGTYDIVPSAAAGTGLSNYTITYVNGTFTVISTPAPSLSVTPASATVCSGTPVAITATVSGGSANRVFTGVNNTRVNIPNNSDDSVSTSANSTISLSDASAATVSSASVISVQFSISHRTVRELDVYLVDPSGTRGMLLTANNGGNGDNYSNTIISTSATNIIGTSGNNSAPFTNTYAPEGSITTVPATNTQNNDNDGSYSTANIGSLALNGATINGTWSLKVFDTSGSTVGTLDNWTLTITNPGVYTSTLVGPEANETITYSGTNNRNVAISMTPPAGVNNYYVETIDAIGCSNISSAIATTVNTAPAITVQPTAPAAVCSGNGTRTISVTATGAGLTYSWRRAGVALTNGGVISGQGTATLTLTNPLAANAGSYDVVITGTCSPTATSTAVSLTVNPNLPASVSIVSNDADNTICAGTSVSFNATPVNGGTPSYQWRWNGTNVGTNSATYTTTGLGNNAQISVIMTSTATCATGSPATSNTITTTVNPNLPASVSIASSDADNAICVGTSVTFTATPTNGGTSPAYQWRLNGTNVGTNSSTYTTTTLATNDIVTVVMTSNATPCMTGSPATSNSITTIVNPNVVASVSIASSDADNAICSGTSVTFTATPTNGGASPTYLWRLNNVNVGTNSPTYTTTTLANNARVEVIMTSNASCVSASPATSNRITTTVNSNAAASVSIVSTNSIFEDDDEICQGTSVTFTASPINGGTPSYQWKLNGANVGTNSATYTTSALANNDSVAVVMTSTATCVTGSPATSNAISALISPNSVAGTVSSNQTITDGDTPSDISLIGSVGDIQWQSSTDNSSFTDIDGATSATLTGASIGTLSATTYFRAVVTSGYCSPVTSSTVTVTVQATFVVGTVSPTEQTICSGTVPNGISTVGSIGDIQWQVSTDNVTFTDIPGATSVVLPGATIGTLNATTYFKCIVRRGNSNTGTAGTVTIFMGGSTTWNGTSWSNGAPTSSTSAIISGNYNVAANINACSLTVNNNAIALIPSGYNVSLSNALTVANGSSFTLANNANLLQQGTTNTNSGAIVVNRNSSFLKRLDYTLWSSPVANQNVLSFSPNTVANRFYTYSSSTNFYEAIVPSNNVFSAARGLLIRVPNTHPTTPTIWTGRFTGVPNNGDYNFNLFYNQVPNADPNLTKVFGFNLVGNPYPSPMSMTEFMNDNRDVINGALYFWRETNGDVTNNSYCIWAGGTFISNVEENISTPKQDPNGIIQTGQGFIVEAKSAGVLKFKNSQRIANNANQFFRTSQNEERNTIWLNVTSTKGAFSQTAISYVTGATQGVDDFDAKVFGTGAVELSSIVEQANYAIQGRALPFDDNDAVALGFKAKAAGDYTISIDRSIGLFAGTQDIFLKDNLTNSIHNLKLSPYTFSAEIGSFNDRFTVVYKNETTLAVAVNNFDLDETISIMFTNNDNTISVKNSSPSTIVESVMLYNLLGQSISTWDVSNENQSALIKVLVRDLSAGTYVVRLKTSEGIIAKKIIIKNVKVTSKTKEKKDIYIQKSMLADED